MFRNTMPPSQDGARDSQQLPPGRHGLPRSFVVQNQRERILAAVADVTSAASYAEMTVADIIVCAGVSRRTFYEHFANKQDAYLAAYDEAVGRLLEGVRWAYSTRETFPDRMRAALELFVTVLAADPAFARMCIVEVTSAGPEALQRRDATMGEFARMMDENARALLPNEPPTPVVGETVVGGLYEVIYTRILRGEVRTLPALVPDLLYAGLLPYVGPEAALTERERLAEEGIGLDIPALGRVARPGPARAPQ
jgi:AcrR family transcriptional regulator